jgi:antitoxin component YwqK of YwqJK toxin-antitoxin module
MFQESEALLRNYLLALWKSSQTYNAELAKARAEAEKLLAEGKGPKKTPAQIAKELLDELEQERTERKERVSAQAAGALDAGRRLGAELTRLAAEADASLARLAELVATADAAAAQAAGAQKQWMADDEALRRVCEEIQALAQRPPTPDASPVVQRLDTVTREAGPVCAAADRALGDKRSGAINAQGLAFRVENGVRAPLARAEARYTAARPAAEALLAQSRQAEALFAKATQADAAATQHAAQTRALAARLTQISAAIDAEVSRFMATAQTVDQRRGQFLDDARHLYASASEEAYKVELRQVAAQVAEPTIDRAAVLGYSRRAQALRTLAAELTTLAGKAHAKCAALPAFVAAKSRPQAVAPLEAALAQADEALKTGRACLARVDVETPSPTPPPRAPTVSDPMRVLERAIASVERERPVATPPSPSSPAREVTRHGSEALREGELIWEKSGKTAGRFTYYTGGEKTCRQYKRLNDLRNALQRESKDRPLAVFMCLHGPAREWAESGALSVETTYVHGLQEGTRTAFFTDPASLGKKQAEYRLVAGKLHGVQRSWRRNGQPGGFVTYQNGQQHGPAEEYSFEGKREAAGQYENDRKTGTWTIYYPDGRVFKTKRYVDGREVN